MITPSFGLTATERVLPKLALDFTTGLLDGRMTFTRTTDATHPATYVNSSGVVTAATNDQPRFDYDPVTLACKGLLIEESRTNLVDTSTLTSWSASNCTVGADGTFATVGSYLITVTGASQSVVRAVSVTSGQSYSMSCYYKRGNADWVRIALQSSGTNAAWFNLSTVSVGTINGAGNTASITDAGNGWYRCVLNVASAPSTGSLNFLSAVSNVDGVVGATAGQTYYMAAPQTELGAFATSYIPTTSAALTRNADVAVMTGTNFSDWFNASEGGAVIQVLPRTISGTRPAVEFDDNTANETIVLRGVAADPQLYVVDGGAAQTTLDAGTITANAAYRLAGAWKSSSFATAINGAASVSQLSGTYPTVTQARFGSDGTNYLNGWLQNFRYWPQRITNAETQAFSK